MTATVTVSCTDYSSTINRVMLLTRGPGELSARQKVKMNVEDGLSRTATVIDDHAIAVLVEPFLGSDGFGNKE